MSCNCNLESKACNPCAFCLPPGVTNLPVCENTTTCKNPIDVKCTTYTGQDFNCVVDVTNGENLWDVLVSILNYLFPPYRCCLLNGTIEIITTTTTSTAAPECVSECGAIYLTGSNNNLYFYNLENGGTSQQLLNPNTSPIGAYGDIAHTGNQFFITSNVGDPFPTSGPITAYGVVNVYTLSLCPFEISTLVKTLTAPAGITILGLTAKATDTLISCKSGGISASSTVIEIDTSGTVPVITNKFSLDTVTPKIITGDLYYSNSGYLYVTTQNLNNSSRWLSKYDYNTGVLVSELSLMSITSPTTYAYALAPINNDLYVFLSNGDVYRVDNMTTFVQMPSGYTGISSASTAPGCLPDPTTSTTTAACQPYYLACCKNWYIEGSTNIVIKPCHANVTFTPGDIYLDSNGNYWIVTGTTGTVTSSYTSWGTFTFINHYSSVPVAFSTCQELAAKLQKNQCPGVPSPPTIYTSEFCYYADTDCGTVCGCISGVGKSDLYYSTCSPIIEGCILYTNPGATLVAPAGFYSDGTTCYEIVGNSGVVTNISACYTTTEGPTYSTNYIAEISNCLSHGGCSNPTGQTVITVADPATLQFGKYYRSTDPNNSNVYRVASTTTTPPTVIVNSLSQSSTCTAACLYVENPGV